MSHGSWCLELYGTKDKRFKGWTPPSFFGNSMQCIREIQKCAEQYLGPSNDFTEKGRKEALRKVCVSQGPDQRHLHANPSCTLHPDASLWPGVYGVRKPPPNQNTPNDISGNVLEAMDSPTPARARGGAIGNWHTHTHTHTHAHVYTHIHTQRNGDRHKYAQFPDHPAHSRQCHSCTLNFRADQTMFFVCV